MPPDPESSAALSRRLSSPRTVSFLDCPKPFVELARLDRLHVGLDKPRQLSRFARRDLASGNCRCDRSHCAGCIISGPKRGQLKAHQPFAPRWPARFEQSQEQMIRVSADRDRLTSSSRTSLPALTSGSVTPSTARLRASASSPSVAMSLFRCQRDQACVLDPAASAYSQLPAELECGADRLAPRSPLRFQGRRAQPRHVAVGSRAVLGQGPQRRFSPTSTPRPRGSRTNRPFARRSSAADASSR
jgi:hypothetical protein